MKSQRKPGSRTAFVDAASGETVLTVEADAQGDCVLSYHLYDQVGNLVCDSGGKVNASTGVELRCLTGELLLLVPPSGDASLQYTLYSRQGVLLTASDGMRTQIYPGLRVEGGLPGNRSY